MESICASEHDLLEALLRLRQPTKLVLISAIHLQREKIALSSPVFTMHHNETCWGIGYMALSAMSCTFLHTIRGHHSHGRRYSTIFSISRTRLIMNGVETNQRSMDPTHEPLPTKLSIVLLLTWNECCDNLSWGEKVAELEHVLQNIFHYDAIRELPCF